MLDIFVKVYAHLTSLPRAEDQHVEKLARCNRQFFTALVVRLLNDLRPFVEIGKCYKQWNDRIVGKESSAEEVFRLGECFEINSNPCRRQRSIWIFGTSRQNLVCNAFRLLKISQRPVGSYEIIPNHAPIGLSRMLKVTNLIPVALQQFRALAKFGLSIIANRAEAFDDVAGKSLVDQRLTGHTDRIAMFREAFERLGSKSPPAIRGTFLVQVVNVVDANVMVIQKVQRDDGHGVSLDTVHRRHLEGEPGSTCITRILSECVLRKRPGTHQISLNGE
ncbi:hypothetical protein [Acetobacter orientalis]|uniref:hypothetical protein n=1 Tax=Acetobacter orientalis TaxID=146474 RepID=UPI0039EC4B1C